MKTLEDALVVDDMELGLITCCNVDGEAKGVERPKGETKRPEGAERKTLAYKLEDSKVIDLSELILPAP